ncbi:MAG: DsrE family protein [Bacillota bacterium]
MKPSICVMITQAPYGTVHAAEAVRHVNGALTNGFEAVAALVDDGVWLALRGQEAGGTGFTNLGAAQAEALANPAGPVPRLVAHGPSLQMRGLSPADLIEGVEIVDDGGLAAVVAGSDYLLRF